MLSHRDLNTLQQAGIDQPDRILSALAELIRQGMIVTKEENNNPLKPIELAFLKKTGAAGLEHIPAGLDDGGSIAALSPKTGRARAQQRQADMQNMALVGQAFASLEAKSLTAQQVAQKLGLPETRVNALAGEGNLYAFSTAKGLMFPCFQFEGHQVLNGLSQVLAMIDHQTDPVSVSLFFETVNQDLESDRLGRAASPREWLLAGEDPKALELLANEL